MATKMAKIFISYDRASKDVVEQLVQDLTDDDHEIWFDQRLTGGQNWWDNILSEIRQCEIFVAALTLAFLESRACQREMNYAKDLQRIMVPVRLSDNVLADSLPSDLSELQWVDYSHPDKQALKSLQRTLRRLPKAPPLPDPLPHTPPIPISYLSGLRAKVDADSQLQLQDQIALVFDLRQQFHKGDPAKEIMDLLQRLKKRDDLFATVSRDIDDLMRDIGREFPISDRLKRREPELSGPDEHNELSKPRVVPVANEPELPASSEATEPPKPPLPDTTILPKPPTMDRSIAAPLGLARTEGAGDLIEVTQRNWLGDRETSISLRTLILAARYKDVFDRNSRISLQSFNLTRDIEKIKDLTRQLISQLSLIEDQSDDLGLDDPQALSILFGNSPSDQSRLKELFFHVDTWTKARAELMTSAREILDLSPKPSEFESTRIRLISALQTFRQLTEQSSSIAAVQALENLSKTFSDWLPFQASR
jgi:TIR domain